MAANLLVFEEEAWRLNPQRYVAGIDEAGRGCLAGPVVAAAVTMAPPLARQLYQGALAGLNDSKQLSASQRLEYFSLLSHTPGVFWGIGACSAPEIDRLNILAATHLAMRRALENLPTVQVHLALVDGLPVRGLPCASEAIVKGDSRSFLIAAASIFAKVTRDKMMLELDKRYPQYSFATNKGYGVNGHIAALFQFGSTPEHRHTFRPVQDADQQLPGLDLRL